MAYFPNGTSAMVLHDQCDKCILPNDAPCPILNVQYTYNYDQCNEGQEKLQGAMNMLIDEKGICQMKLLLDNAIEQKEKELNPAEKF